MSWDCIISLKCLIHFCLSTLCPFFYGLPSVGTPYFYIINTPYDKPRKIQYGRNQLMAEDLKMRSIYLVFISLVFLLAGCQKEDQISMVRITYPYDGAVFFKGEKVRIAVDASAETANVKEVHFSVDGKVVFTDQNAPYEYVWKTESSDVGTKNIGIRVLNSSTVLGEANMMVKVDSTFTDPRDGRTYKIITVGDNVWFAENLAWLPDISQPTEGSNSGKHYYVNGYSGNLVQNARQTANYQKYGALYNFTAAMAACPPGWRIPTDEEWMELERTIGIPAVELGKQGARGANQGAAFKAPYGWPDNGTNLSGFSALPAGYCWPGNYSDDDDAPAVFGSNLASWWTASSKDAEEAWFRSLISGVDGVVRGYHPKCFGLSIRCIRERK